MPGLRLDALDHSPGGRRSRLHGTSHRLGGLLAIVITLQIPYGCWPLAGPTAVDRNAWQIAIAYASDRLLLGNWVMDVAAGRSARRDSSTSAGALLFRVGLAECRRTLTVENDTDARLNAHPETNPLRKACRGLRVPETHAPSCSSGRRATWPIASWSRPSFSSPGGESAQRMRHRRLRPPRVDRRGSPCRVREDRYQERRTPTSEEIWSQFASRIVFSPGTFDDPRPYQKLKETLDGLDRTHGTRGNRVYYLAVSPNSSPRSSSSWARRADLSRAPGKPLEPGGHREAVRPRPRECTELNREVSTVLDESQVYRIDHYLGKETVQNILAFRFGNSMFEPIWDRRQSARCRSRWPRRSAWPAAGCLLRHRRHDPRHGSEPHDADCSAWWRWSRPWTSRPTPCATRRSRCCRPCPRWGPRTSISNVVRAEYTAGSIKGRKSPAIFRKKGVAPDSKTDTYVAIVSS